MAQEFHLKLITERAGGGDPIIRERHVPGPQATIGRAADSDVVLTDLSIDPNHAIMRFSGPGRVTLESTSGLPFQVDGRSVQRADLNASAHPAATFGTYTLAFEPGEDGGVVVTVTHAEHGHHLTPKVFSLQSRLFGRRRMAWTFGLGILLVCLLVPLIGTGVLSPMKIHPDQQWSTGPLSKAHAFLESDCKACHTNAFVAVRDEACLSCHKVGPDAAADAKVIARSQTQGSPFEPLLVADHAPHDKLRKATPLPDAIGPKVSTLVQRAFNHPTDRCASCHLEHTKPKDAVSPTDARAPVTDKPTLVVVQDCESCHAQLKMRLGKTELIDTPDWNRHPKFRPLIMTSAGPAPTFQRMALAGAPQERNGLSFSHRQHLDPLGGVARQAIELGKSGGYGAPLACAACHQRDKSGQGFQPIEMKRDCGGCHSLAYARVGGVLQVYPHGSVPELVKVLDGGVVTSSAAASDRQRPGMIRPTSFGSPAARNTLHALTAPGGMCADCHAFAWPADGSLPVAEVKLTAHYMPRGAFDHAVPEHGGPGQSKAGGFKCADCHKASVSEHASDVLVPDIAKCAACHGKTKAQTAAADNADCTTCHSFHAPGQATAKPGLPPLETLRWSQATAKAASAPAGT